MKRFFLIFSILVFSFRMSAQTLSEIAVKLNSTLPQTTSFITTQKVSFVSNFFVVKMSFNGGKMFNMAYFNAKPKEGKEWFKLWSINIYKEYPYMFHRMVEKNVNFKIIVDDISNEEKCTTILTPVDIKNAISKYADMDDDLRSLTSQMLSTNIQSPQQIDEITFMTGAELTSDAFIYKYTVDDSFVEMDAIQEFLNENKAAQLATYKVADTFMVKSCISTRRNLKFVYVGKKSKKVASLIYSPRELAY